MSYEKFNYKPIQILTIEEYRDLYDVPLSNDLTDQNTLITKWILSAQDQLNSISNNKLYSEIGNLDPTIPSDQEEFYNVKRCIGDWVEYEIQTSRIWVDAAQNVQGAVPLDLTTQSENGDVEQKRLDILRKFSLTRFYKTRATQDVQTNFTPIIEDVTSDAKSTWFSTLLNDLKAYFKTIDNANAFTTNQNFSAPLSVNDFNFNSLFGVGNITSASFDKGKENWPTISGFNFAGTTTGEVLQSNLAIKANTVLDPTTSLYYQLEDFPNIAFFGDDLSGTYSVMTRQQVQNLIALKNSAWNAEANYSLGVFVLKGYVSAKGEEVLAQFESLQANNKGHDPLTSPLWWKYWPTGEVDYNAVVKEALAQTVAIFTPLFEEYKLQTLDTINTSFTDLSAKLNKEISDFEISLNNKYLHLGMQLSNNVQAAIDTIPVEIDTQLNALPTIDIDFYPKGKVLSFITKVLGVEFITSKGWVEGVDYEVLTIGQYLRIGENGNTVGDLNLPQSALPNIGYNLAWTGASKDAVGSLTSDKTGNLISSLSFGAVGQSFNYLNSGTTNTLMQWRYSFNLNGNVTQTRNQPIAQQVWAIQMLKTRSEKGVIRSLPTIGWNDIIGPWTDRVELVNEFAKYTTLVNFNTLQTEVNTIRTDLGDMGDIVNENTNKITLNTTNITTNTTDLTAIKANYLTTNTVQNITAAKTISVNNNFLDYKVSAESNWGGFRVLQNNVEAFLFGKAGGGSEGIIKAPLGNILIQPKDAVVINNKPIKGVSNPTNGTDVANKQYVDSNNHSWTKKAYAQEVKWFNSGASREAFKTANGLTASQCVDMNIAVGSLNFPAVRFLVDIA